MLISVDVSIAVEVPVLVGSAWVSRSRTAGPARIGIK
jgi:hypothetical protein